MDGALVQRAVDAAAAVAGARGLDVEGPTTIAAGSNVLVRVGSAPVVARVMTGTVVLHDDPRRWLEREVGVVRFLEPTGLAVAPSPLISPGPDRHDGLWMTWVALVEDVVPGPTSDAAVSPDDAAAVGTGLRALHDALAGYDGELGDARELERDVDRLLAAVADPAERVRLADRLQPVRDAVFHSDLPVRALHGDASITNLLSTPRGRLWNDFEDAFRGPAHWDVASLVADLQGRGSDPAAVKALLDAYGWRDPAELAPFRVAQDVYAAAWRAHDRERRRG